MLDFSWYSLLVKPYMTPPAWIFTPVWTLLYLLMLIALFLYLRKKHYKSKGLGYILFFMQLLINMIWPVAFFGMKNIGFALALIFLLDTLVLFNILEFSKISKSAGRCLIPYFIWILFATYLNFGYFVLN